MFHRILDRIGLANSSSPFSPCCEDVDEADEAAVPDPACCIAPCLGPIDFFLFSAAESNILSSSSDTYGTFGTLSFGSLLGQFWDTSGSLLGHFWVTPSSAVISNDLAAFPASHSSLFIKYRPRKYTGLRKRNGAKLRESFCPAAASHSRPRQASA